MATTPNTTFTAGAILTATQQNNFPRGMMTASVDKATASDATITAEEVQITGSSFTAVANRLYKITYHEPSIYGSATAGYTLRIRQTNLAGTVLNASSTWGSTLGYPNVGICIAYTTFAAGTQNVVATLACNTGTGQALRSATQYASLVVEDIGSA